MEKMDVVTRVSDNLSEQIQALQEVYPDVGVLYAVSVDARNEVGIGGEEGNIWDAMVMVMADYISETKQSEDKLVVLLKFVESVLKNYDGIIEKMKEEE